MMKLMVALTVASVILMPALMGAQSATGLANDPFLGKGLVVQSHVNTLPVNIVETTVVPVTAAAGPTTNILPCQAGGGCFTGQ